jgi:hypothetical protein
LLLTLKQNLFILPPSSAKATADRLIKIYENLHGQKLFTTEALRTLRKVPWVKGASRKDAKSQRKYSFS